jgi:arylsulfatase A-like enzyme
MSRCTADGSYEPRDAVFAEHGIEAADGALRTHTFHDLEDIPTTPTSPDFAPRQKKGDLGPIKSIRTREWKLVYYPGNTEGELYDLTQDPGELINLWSHPDRADLRAELTSRILDWCIATEDRRPPIQAGGF